MAKGLLLIIGFSAFVSTIKGNFFGAIGKAVPGVKQGSEVFAGVGGAVGVDTTGLTEITCRKGCKSFPGDLYTSMYLECFQALKNQPNNSTTECIHICWWRKLNWVDPASGTINRKQVEDSANDVFPGDEGRQSAESLIEDFENCFKQTKASTNYDNDGCKSNKEFTKCFVAKADKACNRKPQPAVPDTTSVPPSSENIMGGQPAATPLAQNQAAVVVSPGNPVTATPPAQKPVTAAPHAQLPVTAAPPAQKPVTANPPTQNLVVVVATTGNPVKSTPSEQNPVTVTPHAQSPVATDVASGNLTSIPHA